MTCLNALNNLYADPLGKGIICGLTCRKFSEVNHNNLADLEDAELCNRVEYNFENACNLTQNFQCGQQADPKHG